MDFPCLAMIAAAWEAVSPVCVVSSVVIRSLTGVLQNADGSVLTFVSMATASAKPPQPG